MNKYNDIKIIGLTGPAGCGKDTLAGLLQYDGCVHAAFADSLKQMCIQFLGLSKDDVYTRGGKGRFNEFWGMTNREILQKVGTQAFRNGFHKDCWVKIAQLKFQNILNNNQRLVVTDCRFDNEAKLIQDMGGVVFKIERPGYQSELSENENKHASEGGIQNKYISGIVLNNETVNDLKRYFFITYNNFINKHANLANQLEMMVSQNNIQEISNIEKFLLNLKKWFDTQFNSIFYIQEKQMIRFECNEIRGYYISLQFYYKTGNIIFNLKDGKKIDYQIQCQLDDYKNWYNINTLVKNLM